MSVSLGEGFRVGHWTHPSGATGCTVILPPPGNVCAYDMRGSSPGSRELPPLDLSRPRTEVHAVVLCGGSAFGLAAADGVMAWLESKGVGLSVGEFVIPIVPAAVIFDGSAASPDVRPDAAAGIAACEAASEGVIETGLVGAGAGATVGKWAGLEHRSPGGLGLAEAVRDEHRAVAIAVVNSVGDVVGQDGTVIAGTTAADPVFAMPPSPQRTNTVLAVVMTNATLDKRQTHFLAARGSDGIAIAIRPAHTQYDGDIVFAISAPASFEANVDLLGVLATEAVASAVRSAVS